MSLGSEPWPMVLAARLALAYPGRTIDEGHVASWAEVLSSLQPAVAADVVDLLRARCVDPPAVAQIHEAIAERRRETPSPRQLELPEGVEMPAEVQERIAELQEQWAEDDTRSKAEVDADWRRRIEAMKNGPQRRDFCAGAGVAPVERDGKLVCGDCGAEIPARKGVSA